ncbi:MAG: YceD family protein [Bacilli bacterium]
MRISKQELLAKGQHLFEENINYDKSLYENNPLIDKIGEINAEVSTNLVSDLIMVSIALKGEMILRSTRSLKPVNHEIDLEDEIVYTYNKDLVDNEQVFLLEDDELDLDKTIYSLIISSIPLKVIASDDKESYSGENWEVITEDEYNKRKNSEENSPFASLKDLDLYD